MNTHTTPETNPAVDIVKWAIALTFVVAIVIGNAYFEEQPFLYRLIGVLVGGVLAALVALQTVKGKAFLSLLKDARSEVRRIVWPTRPETIQTTLIVLVCVGVVAFFLWLMDLGLGAIISAIIG